MGTTLNLKTGRAGEKIAAEHLEKNGCRVIERNYRTKYGEIDLVAEESGVLVFVEVRTKIGERFGAPEDTLNKKKIMKLRVNGRAYAAAKKWNGPCRADAVCVVLEKDFSIRRVRHYKNI